MLMRTEPDPILLEYARASRSELLARVGHSPVLPLTTADNGGKRVDTPATGPLSP
jgi:hypothetical protein